MQTGYMKRALKYDKQGICHVDCECGQQVFFDSRNAFAKCQCGIEYDDRGWIIRRPLGQSDKPSHQATVLP